MPRTPSIEPTHRVARGGTLILGGGYAGAHVARSLGRRGATIVDPSNFMLYTPLLPEAAGGSIEPRHVAVPLRTMCPHADLLVGSAVALDHERRTVTVGTDSGRSAVTYTDLVIALGSVTRMPAVDGLAEHAFPLKDLPDAIRLRNHVLRQIDLADADPGHAASRLTFVFGGAGFAGVETVAELQELASGAPRQARPLAGSLTGPARPYGYRTRGQMAALGAHAGVAALGPLRLRRRAGRLAARGYHLAALPFAARRLRVLADWAVAALFPRDVAELTAVGGGR